MWLRSFILNSTTLKTIQVREKQIIWIVKELQEIRPKIFYGCQIYKFILYCSSNLQCAFFFCSGSLVTVGNVVYVLLFGWWISLFYFLVSLLMFFSIAGIPYGRLDVCFCIISSLQVFYSDAVVLTKSPLLLCDRKTMFAAVGLFLMALWKGNKKGTKCKLFFSVKVRIHSLSIMFPCH